MLGEYLVRILTARAVGEAFDRGGPVRVFGEEIAEPVEIRRRARLDLRLSRGKQRVTQREHQAAIRGFGLHDLELPL